MIKGVNMKHKNGVRQCKGCHDVKSKEDCAWKGNKHLLQTDILYLKCLIYTYNEKYAQYMQTNLLFIVKIASKSHWT